MIPRHSLHPLHRALVLTLALCTLATPAAWAASTPAPQGTGGAVASAEPQATAVGLEILAAGGNAVDGAVATALALAVVFPEAGNLGGGGFAVVKMGDTVATLDFREVAPAAAHPTMYLDADGEPVPRASLDGPLAAGVPGSPRGLFDLHRRFGRLPWGAVVEPARRLAALGFPVRQQLHDNIADEAELFARFPETAALWLPNGAPPPVGSLLRLPDLAETLRRYGQEGPTAVTTGPVAEAVEAVSRRHGGILTTADLAAYQTAWREPVRFRAYGWDFASMGLPSSGGIILGQSFALLEGLGWQQYPRFGAERAHLLVEVLRRSFADRYLLGDPTTTGARPEDLLDPAWLATRQREIDRHRAGDSEAVQWWPGEVPEAEAAETTHLSVVDADGNLVALTTTLNGYFGCGLYVPGAGFFLNNEMDDFAAAPGKPNMFGLIQGEANAVRAGKRMLSSMSPTIAWRDGEALAAGGRGGSRIPTNTLQVLLNRIVDGDDLQSALDRPRLHHQWLPDVVQAEPDTLSPETRTALESRGHTVEITTSTAKVQAVRWLRTPGGTLVEAAADPRSGGAAGALAQHPTPPLPGQTSGGSGE
jgi:gamma-glutamyltranspeptidase / glutathione hydrolase